MRRPKPLVDSDLNLLGMPIVHNVGGYGQTKLGKVLFSSTR
jgi:hypothetical protein